MRTYTVYRVVEEYCEVAVPDDTPSEDAPEMVYTLAEDARWYPTGAQDMWMEQ